VQSIQSGTRAAVHIDSADAPERYTFGVGGNAARLSINDDGSITILDAADQSIGQIAAPWARDANGVAVPTHYDVDGLTLTQVVEHRGGDYAYAITADPAVITWTHFGWRFGHTNSERVFHYLAVGVISGIAGVVCAAITENPAIGYGCATMVGAIASDIGKSAARSALAGNKCLEFGRYFFPPFPYAKITGC
jgi:hypothetical protein